LKKRYIKRIFAYTNGNMKEANSHNDMNEILEQYQNDFIDDEYVLFKDYTMLQLKTIFYSLPTGASGGGNLPRGYASLKKAIDMHRHYTSIKLSNSPKK